MMICSEPTYEGYVRLTAGGLPSMGLFSDEGGAFFGGFGMSPDHRLKTAAALSDLWDGKPIKRVRAGDGSFTLPGRRLAVHLMAQPGVAWNFLGDPVLADQGLLSRVLVSAPASTMGTRFHVAPSLEAQAALRAYHSSLRCGARRAICRLRTARGTSWSRGNCRLHEKRRRPASPIATRSSGSSRRTPWLRQISGFAAKAVEQATRIAGVLDADRGSERDGRQSRANAGGPRAYGSLSRRDGPLARRRRRPAETARGGAALGLDPAQMGRACDLSDADLSERSAAQPSAPASAVLEVLAILEEHGWLHRIEGGDRWSRANGARKRGASTAAPFRRFDVCDVRSVRNVRTRAPHSFAHFARFARRTSADSAISELEY